MPKNLRITRLYKTMTAYLACAYAEQFCEGTDASEEEQLIAWQWISDHDTWKTLQGWYGRTVHNLLEEGHIKPKK